MRTMYDGIASDAAAIARIPTAIELVAGYVDGDYAWSPADWALFPNSIHVGIAVHATTNAGIVLDVENGDATPAQSVTWVVTRRGSGADPTVYCSESTWPTVRSAFGAAAVAEPHYWIADYDGSTAIPAGAVAHQYESTTRWDLSSVADYWPGVDPAPTPQPAAAAAIEEETMAQAEDGQADIGWSEGVMRLVQVGCDGGAALNQGHLPTLRVTLLTRGGAVVLAGDESNPPWQPTVENPVLNFDEHRSTAYAIVLESVGFATRYSAIVAP